MTTSGYTNSPARPKPRHGPAARSGQPVISKRGQVAADDASRFIRRALEDVRAYMREHDLEPAGPPFAICIPAARTGQVDVEAGWPLEQIAQGAGAIHSATLPHAVVRHSIPDSMLV
jgi:hypothetical protein